MENPVFYYHGCNGVIVMLNNIERVLGHGVNFSQVS